MKALKYYVSMLITCALIMGIGSSACGKDNQSKGKESTTTVRGGDGNKRAGAKSSEKMPDTVTNTKEGSGNKKDVASDRNQDDVPVKTGSATPVGQIQATDQERMQGLKHVEELSVLMQGMRKSVQEIGSKQDGLRKDVESFSRVAKGGDRSGVMSFFVGAIAVILILMGNVGGVWYLNGRIAKQLHDIRMNSSGDSVSTGNSLNTDEIKQTIVNALQSYSWNGNRTVTAVVPQHSIDTIKTTLSKKLEELANLHFGSKGANLDKSVTEIETAVGTLKQSLSSVDTLKTESQQITSSANSLKSSVQEVIGSLNTAMTNFTTDVKNATSSFCNAESVRLLPEVQKLMKELSGALTQTNAELKEEVAQLKKDIATANNTISSKEAEITRVERERDEKGTQLLTEQGDHQKDNDTKGAEIQRLNGVITGLQSDLEKTGAEKEAAQTSFAGEQARREEVEAEKGRLEEVIAKRDEWNQSLFPSWFEDQSLKSLHDTLCSEFVSESPSMECLLFRAALLELRAMESRGMPDGIESLLTRLGRYCFAYLSEKKFETKDMFEFGKRIATLVSESDMVKPTGVYVRVPKMGFQVDLQWMRSLSNERTIQTIRTWSVSTRNGLYSKAEVN